MTKQTESRIVDKIIARLKLRGDAQKVKCAREGEPDIVGEYYIRNSWLHVKFEVKTEKGEATPLQLNRIADYQAMGYCAGVVRSWDEVHSLIIQHIENWERPTTW